jgi:diacylglycerol kinase family enzyme
MTGANCSRKVLIIYSPYSGRAEELSAAITSLRQIGVEIVDMIPIDNLGAAAGQGGDWARNGIEMVIAAGGDGLIGSIAKYSIGSNLPLGILPLGTSNDIARSLHIPVDVKQAVQTIIHGKIIEIDLGSVQPAQSVATIPSRQDATTTSIASEKRDCFVHALTVGLNVQFAHLATNVTTRKRYGRLTYPIAAFTAMTHHAVFDITLRFEGLALHAPPTMLQAAQQSIRIHTGEQPVLRCRALQATIVNAPIFGGMWNLTIPYASLEDQLLDIVVIEDMDLPTLSSIVAHSFSPQSGQLNGMTTRAITHSILQKAELSFIPGIHHVQARGVTISTSSDPQDITLDGEVRAQTPGYVHMADQRLRVVVPESYAIFSPARNLSR